MRTHGLQLNPALPALRGIIRGASRQWAVLPAMDSPWRIESLPDLETEIWETLHTATLEGGMPWRTPIFATTGADGTGVDARVMVLRKADRARRELMCHTDSRSAKVAELRKSPGVIWVFQDPVQRVQLRARARAQVHVDDAVADAAWEEVPEFNRRNYCGPLAPGTPMAAPSVAQGIANMDTPHFAVILTTVAVFDWLWLAVDGHRRAQFRYHAEGVVTAEWLAP